MADAAYVESSVESAPKDYTIAASQELLVKAVRAVFNGSAAQGAYLPAVQLIAPSGAVMFTAVPEVSVAAGVSADVSFFPGGNVEEAAASTTPTTPTAPGITTIASPTGTITVTSPSGPTADVDLPVTGVGAGTYGDATHVAEVTVDAEGRVTAATSVPISGSGGAGGLIVLYDSGILGADAASIDTGAGGIAAGHVNLLVVAYVRSSNAVGNDNLNMIFNNDSSAIYQVHRVQTTNGGTSSNVFTALTAALIGICPGNNATANYWGSLKIVIPSYDNGSHFKAGTYESVAPDSSGGNYVGQTGSFGYGSVNAISRLKLTSGANIKAGSRLIVYGME